MASFNDFVFVAVNKADGIEKAISYKKNKRNVQQHLFVCVFV